MYNLIGERIRGWAIFFYLTDFVFLLLAFSCASWITTFRAEPHFIPLTKDYIVLLICLVGMLVSLLTQGIQGGYVDAICRNRCFSITIQQFMFLLMPVLFYLAIWRDHAVSRSIVLTFFLIGFPALYLSKLVARIMVRGGLLPVKQLLRILTVNNSEDDSCIENWLIANKGLGIGHCGSLVIPGKPTHEFTLKSLEEALKKNEPNLVIWGLDMDSALLLESKVMVERHGAHLSLDLSSLAGRPGDSRDAYYPPECLLSFHKQPLISPANSLAKRLLDILVSIPVILFVLPPCCVLVWLLHRIYSPGPLFFHQKRSGSHGRNFKVRKFRTMSVDHGEQGKQARHGDKRMFPGGDLLRKLSIDEFPQFINVLLGQMSVVGPRPHMLEHDVIFARDFDQYKLRQMVKPGITGLAQVRGYRGPIDSPQEVRDRLTSDLEYCERWTVFLDLFIIFRTVAHVFSFHSKSC